MKMKDFFAVPVKASHANVYHGNGNGDLALNVVFELGDNSEDDTAYATAHAINCHDELVTELKNMRDRFYSMLVSTGTAPEFAADAVASADAILTKANGE